MCPRGILKKRWLCTFQVYIVIVLLQVLKFSEIQDIGGSSYFYFVCGGVTGATNKQAIQDYVE